MTQKEINSKCTTDNSNVDCSKSGATEHAIRKRHRQWQRVTQLRRVRVVPQSVVWYEEYEALQLLKIY